MKKEKYQSEVCPHCQQSLTYELQMDRGSNDILKEIAKFVKIKGINAVHPAKEMMPGILTGRQLDNIVRLKFHGLIAHINNERGNFAITTKGINFLNDQPIPLSVIIKKRVAGKRAHVIAHSDETITISQIDKEWGPYWSANGYEIREGRIITTPPVKSNPKYQMAMV